MAGESVQPSQGRKKRVRSGCQTCRIRRVKCDEMQPACQRCVSTGRTCDGYGIWGGGGNGYGRPTTISSSITRAAPSPSKLLAPTANLSAEDQTYLNWFAYRSAKKLPGTFLTPFWKTLIFQASASEPAVLHSVLALSAAHWGEVNTRGGSRSLTSGNPDSRERFTLRHYNRAIKHLMIIFDSKSETSVRSALIACLLLTFTEYLRGNYNAGNIHLRSGINLLREKRIPRGRKSSDGALDNQYLGGTMDDSIVETFVKVQTVTGLLQHDFWQLAPVMLPPGMHLSGPMFESVEQARLFLDLLLSQILDLVARRQKERAMHGHAMVPSPGLVREHKCLQAGLASWVTAYKSSRTRLRASLSPRDAFGYRALHTQYTVAKIMAETSLRTDEMAFEAYLPEFLSVLAELVEMSSVAAPELWKKDENLAHKDTERGSISDVGGLPYMYYVAIKCRDHRVRRQAAQLPAAVPHKEGIWDSALVVCLAQEVVAIEEGDFYEHEADQGGGLDLTSLPTEEELRMPCLPNSRRLHEVHVMLPGDAGGNIILTGSRTREDGTEECIRREYNQQKGCWTDAARCT